MIDFIDLFMFYQKHAVTMFSYLNAFVIVFSISNITDIMRLNSEAREQKRPSRQLDIINIIIAATMLTIALILVFAVGHYVQYIIDVAIGVEFIYSVYMIVTMSSEHYRVHKCRTRS